jgi:predicted amidohydrolase
MSKSIVAAVQWAPEVLNPVAGGEKAAAAIAEAADKGAQLVVFPECWLQGYPYWSGLAPTDPEYQAFRQISFETAITVDDHALEPVYQAAATHQCTVVLGLHEKEGGTIYCTLLYIGADGRILGKHRKLIPTQAERCLRHTGGPAGGAELL